MAEFNRDEFITSYLDDIISMLEQMKKDSLPFFKRVADILLEARENGNMVFIMGNGGSAATASHFVCDLAKGTIVPGQKRFKAHSLSDNVPVMMAWGNDSSYEDIFVEQLKNLMEPGDVVIGISGSGNSENVLRAVQYANEKGNTTIGLTGYSGGKLSEMVKEGYVFNIHYMQKVEDLHMLFEHLLTSMIREEGSGINCV